VVSRKHARHGPRCPWCLSQTRHCKQRATRTGHAARSA
jgi:hypothetical protein